MIDGDHLSVYDVQDHNRAKIAELDLNFNHKKKTFSGTGSHSMMIHLSTDEVGVDLGFKALIHYFPSNANCADFLDETEFIFNQAIDCNWIITAPFVSSTITIQVHYFEVHKL